MQYTGRIVIAWFPVNAYLFIFVIYEKSATLHLQQA